MATHATPNSTRKPTSGSALGVSDLDSSAALADGRALTGRLIQGGLLRTICAAGCYVIDAPRLRMVGFSHCASTRTASPLGSK
jgi:hypothetical protein